MNLNRVSHVKGRRALLPWRSPATQGTNKAFTLVEAVLTMGLVMLLIAGAMSALMYLNDASARLADHTAAMATVHGRLEAIRATAYNPPNTPFTASEVRLTNQVTVALGKDGTSLEPGTIISVITPVAAGHLVTVTGTFQSRGVPLVVSLQSLVNRFAGGQE